MKTLMKFIAAAAILSGAVSFRITKNGNTVTIETEADPEAAAEAAGALISAADSALRAAGVTVQEDIPAVYRIRNSAGEAVSQLGAYSDYGTAVQMCPAGYCVFDMQNQLMYAG